MSSFVTKCTRSAPASDTENLIRESLDSIDSATCVHSHINAPYLQEFWCQRRDSNSQTPVSKTGRYSNSRTLAHLYEGCAAKTRGSAPRQLLALLGARIGSPGAQGRISAPARENRACRGLWSMQLRMPVPPRAWSIKLKLDRGSVTQSESTEEL